MFASVDTRVGFLESFSLPLSLGVLPRSAGLIQTGLCVGSIFDYFLLAITLLLARMRGNALARTFECPAGNAPFMSLRLRFRAMANGASGGEFSGRPILAGFGPFHPLV